MIRPTLVDVMTECGNYFLSIRTMIQPYTQLQQHRGLKWWSILFDEVLTSTHLKNLDDCRLHYIYIEKMIIMHSMKCQIIQVDTNLYNVVKLCCKWLFILLFFPIKCFFFKQYLGAGLGIIFHVFFLNFKMWSNCDI